MGFQGLTVSYIAKSIYVLDLSPCCFLRRVLCTCANLLLTVLSKSSSTVLSNLLSTVLSNLICTLNASPSFISLSRSHQMRFLAIVSVFVAVVQVAFAAPVLRGLPLAQVRTSCMCWCDS
ncbi:hypothetical protein K439DRAFT_665259 [Ramaria rubella]|nr:hypothetical protein K439DRAFT_665259 [Ramaria rubella]